MQYLGDDEDRHADPPQAPAQVVLARDEYSHSDRQGKDQNGADWVGIHQDGIQICLRN